MLWSVAFSLDWSNLWCPILFYFDLLRQVNEAGTYIVAAESGDLLYWDMATRKVVPSSPAIGCQHPTCPSTLLCNISVGQLTTLAQVVHQEKQENIQQIFYYKNQSRCVVVSKKGSKGNESGLCVSRFSGKVQT